MDLIEVQKIGTLELNDQVDITDPCYDKNVWCRMTTECKPGTYTGYAEISDEGGLGHRVASISIYKDDIMVPARKMECIGSIGVDAGMAGFFRNKPDFKDDEWEKFMTDSQMRKPDGSWDYTKHTYIIDYGIFSSSGFGDGGYDVFANADRTAFRIEFIVEEEEDEYDDEEEYEYSDDEENED